MKQVLVKNGEIVVESVPPPAAVPGHLLVRVHYSLISTGTEMSVVATSSASLLDRIRKKPELIRKGLDSIKEKGLTETLRIATGGGSLGQPLGYSAAGKIVEVGDGVSEFRAGDLVACAGAGMANHAELISVPRNLTVRIPEGVSVKQASSVTLGAIAMQGLRQAEPRLGEIVMVSGLGLIGLLTVQMLRANGCRVIGLDIDPERLALASELGAEATINATDDNLVERALSLSDGMGVDTSIITAATESDAPLNLAMKYTRRKGKVVVVGAVGLNLNRSPFYEKEIDLRISCSYGPGRYDASYELQGLDYPYAYVRWTENRNMEAYLQLVAAGKINVNRLAQREYEIEQAPEAYRVLSEASEKPLAVLLRYEQEAPPQFSSRVEIAHPSATPKAGVISVGLIGAGAFAVNSLLPNLQSLSDRFRLHAVVSQNGLKAKEAAGRFGAKYATSDVRQLLADPEIDTIFIATRHDSHAELAASALDAGKAVFLEKPMALDGDGLQALSAAIGRSDRPFTTGFNRRFSPLCAQIRDLVSKRSGPLIVTYQMNAGFIPPDHWTQSPAGGGRNIGEACHIYDLFGSLTNSTVRSISADGIGLVSERHRRNDNFVATIVFDDGSVCTLTYTALGNPTFPKEQMTVFCDNQVLTLNDYRELTLWSGAARVTKLPHQDKGHLALLRQFAEGIKKGERFVIPVAQIAQATEISFEVERLLTR